MSISNKDNFSTHIPYSDLCVKTEITGGFGLKCDKCDKVTIENALFSAKSVAPISAAPFMFERSFNVEIQKYN